MESYYYLEILSNFENIQRISSYMGLCPCTKIGLKVSSFAMIGQ